MVSSKPVFKIVDNVDSTNLKDLPYLEILAVTDSNHVETHPKRSIVENLAESQKDQENESIISQSGEPCPASEPMRFSGAERSGIFLNYPPLPVFVVGLFILVAMFLGE